MHQFYFFFLFSFFQEVIKRGSTLTEVSPLLQFVFWHRAVATVVVHLPCKVKYSNEWLENHFRLTRKFGLGSPFIFFGFALVPFHIFGFCLGAPLTCLAALKKILRDSTPKTESCLSLKLVTFEACDRVITLIIQSPVHPSDYYACTSCTYLW